MPQLRNHRSAHVPNAPLRPLAGMTIAQLGAVASALTIGAVLWWALGLITVASVWYLFGRTIGCGMLAGVLAVVAYAVVDEDREPVIRQAVGYAVRRHHYTREDPHGPTSLYAVRRASAPRRTNPWRRS